MNKSLNLIWLAFGLILGFTGCRHPASSPPLAAGGPPNGAGQAGPTEASVGGVVHRWGWLEVKSGQLCDQSGRPIQLRGMSSHDLKQYPFRTNTVEHLARDWHISVVRAAMYTDSYGSSYIRDPGIKQAVKLIVDEAIRNDVYVIVDWHILEDGNPNRYREQAKDFFQEMARTYGRHPNVIYEICNEPNGSGVTWKEIKAYAEFIIPTIRTVAPNAVVIVGTDTWSQGVRAAAADPLSFSNVLYALHFYAGTHGEELRAAADDALSRGAALFVSEWGLTDYTGRGRLYLDAAETWMTWMDQHQISWANWSFSNCNESSAALKPEADMNGPWPEAELNPSGEWIRSRF
ncbi:MAG TPA: glycoside hydrolase family 5 protein [Candidatus Acidoferrum sp.]|nr:glycoside hydrolase family 5 protein [Candidatus Acidoferrum sp.]